jgi:hypothetical protein
MKFHQNELIFGQFLVFLMQDDALPGELNLDRIKKDCTANKKRLILGSRSNYLICCHATLLKD